MQRRVDSTAPRLRGFRWTCTSGRERRRTKNRLGFRPGPVSSSKFNVPVDAFWSVIVYDETGHLQKNQYDAYSLNSVTAKSNTDGSVAVQFGGYDGKIPNCLPIMKGWNYMVRLYRLYAEILNGTWKSPEAQPSR